MPSFCLQNSSFFQLDRWNPVNSRVPGTPLKLNRIINIPGGAVWSKMAVAAVKRVAVNSVVVGGVVFCGWVFMKALSPSKEQMMEVSYNY
jgi:hypothetical protein